MWEFTLHCTIPMHASFMIKNRPTQNTPSIRELCLPLREWRLCPIHDVWQNMAHSREMCCLLHLFFCDIIPSREPTYPPKMAFWRWFSFSQGGICYFPGRYTSWVYDLEKFCNTRVVWILILIINAPYTVGGYRHVSIDVDGACWHRKILLNGQLADTHLLSIIWD